MERPWEWSAFTGTLGLLAGVILFGTADRKAEDAVLLDRRRRGASSASAPALEDQPLRLQIRLMCRGAGALFAAAGAGILLAAAAGVAVGYPKKPGGELLAGALMTAIGAAIEAGAWRRRARERRFMGAELLGEPPRLPLGERVAAACVRGMAALCLVFGARLLAEGFR